MGRRPVDGNCIANLAEVHTKVEKGRLHGLSKVVAEYLLQHKPISIEQICAGLQQEKEDVDEVMEKHQWYSGLPQLSRISAIDDLVEQGIPSLREIGNHTEKKMHPNSVRFYLETRGLYEYWEMKRNEKGLPIYRKREQKVYPSLRNPSTRKLPPYDPATIYTVGQTLFFDSFGAGQVVEADSRRITVTLNGGEKREFVHGVAHDPHYRSRTDME